MNQKWIDRAQAEEITPLQNIFKQAPSTSRLKSRSPFYLPKNLNYNTHEKWREEWNNKIPNGGELVDDPCAQLPGLHKQRRKYWTAANCLRCRVARTADNMHRW